MKTTIYARAILAFVVLLPGCGALVVTPQSARKQVQEDIPPIGTVVRVELGEKMMVQKDYEAVTGVSVPLTRISMNGLPFDLNGFYEMSANGYFCGVTTSRVIGSDGRMNRTCFTEAEFRSHVPGYKTTEVVVPKTGNIQRVIEYTGRSDNRLTFSYREYNETKDGVFIRPAYTQDFNFDLAQGSEIGLKGARVRVIEATNTGIRYEVLKHFPK